MSSSCTIDSTTLIGFLQALANSASSQRHALRSPLSVLSGVIEDIHAGVALEAEDIEDAQLALERLTALLSTFRIPTIPKKLLDELPNEQSCVRSNELQTWLESLFSLPCRLSAPNNSEESTVEVPKPFLAALVGLELAVMDRLWRTAQDDTSLGNSRLALIVDTTSQKLVLEIHAPPQADASVKSVRAYEGFESELIALYCALLSAEQIEAHTHCVRYHVPLTTKD